MVVVAQSDVDTRTADREDFTLPLLQGADCEMYYANACQGHALTARFLCFLGVVDVRCVVARQGIFFLFLLGGCVVARQLGILRLRRLVCPMLRHGRIEDAGYPLRGLQFGAALLTETLKFSGSGNSCRTVTVCKRWQRRLLEAKRFLWHEHVLENLHFAAASCAWAAC